MAIRAPDGANKLDKIQIFAHPYYLHWKLAITTQHARDGGLRWSQCEQIVFEIERKLKHTESGYPTLSNTHPGSSESFCLMTTFLKQRLLGHRV